MDFAEVKRIAWRTFAEVLGITEPTAALTGASSSTFLRGDGTWAVPATVDDAFFFSQIARRGSTKSERGVVLG